MHPKANVEKMAFRVVKPAEIHRYAQRIALSRQRVKGLFLVCCGVSLLRQAAAGTRNRQQVTGEVTAVNGRDISWLQNFERLRLVPVKQVAFVLGQAFDRAQCCTHFFDDGFSADPAKLARARDR